MLCLGSFQQPIKKEDIRLLIPLQWNLTVEKGNKLRRISSYLASHPGNMDSNLVRTTNY